MKNQELIILSKFEEDSKWFFENIGVLREKFEKKFVAVKDKEVIVSGNNLDNVINALKRENINPALTVIEFIHEKGHILIL